MKGIVMEKNNNKVIIMTNDGEFLEVSERKNVQIGEEIIINNNMNKNNIMKRFIATAAILVLVLTGTFGAYGYCTPYGYVNVDINPSVEITYNLFNRVIDIKGLNDDGNKIVEKVENYKNKSIDSIVNEIVDKAIEDKYIESENENTVLVTITEDGKKIDDKKIFSSVKKHINETETESELLVIKNDKKSLESAREKDLSPGRMALINKALKTNKESSFEEISKKSVKEIVSIIKGSRKREKKEFKNKKKQAKNEKKNKKDKLDKERKADKEDKKNNKQNKDTNKKDKEKVNSKKDKEWKANKQNIKVNKNKNNKTKDEDREKINSKKDSEWKANKQNNNGNKNTKEKVDKSQDNKNKKNKSNDKKDNKNNGNKNKK
ncbi:MAG: anti-sigma factor domain-containing protein [Firmicutes bacterium]|nr:anti-sigma factor domain-containing protein [Bacillota bacterium]